MRATAGVLLVLALAPPAAAAPAAPARLDGPTRSDICGGCHKDIYRMWRASAHARSMESDVFLEVYRDTEREKGAAVSRTCLGCHAPMIQGNGDLALAQKVTWEGVSCDVCHSMKSVDMTPGGPKVALDVGRVMRGPLRDAVSSAHEVSYSELHTSALMCAACHEYVNSEGLPILTTYSEWKQSKLAQEGKTCQTCHMSRTGAHVVDPRVARTAEAEVNLHEMPGGHSLDQLHRALSMTVQPKREGDFLVVDIGLANREAGHSVPTGMPGRRVILDISLQTSLGQSFQEQRTYSKEFKDASGNAVTRDGECFAKGVRLGGDSRIKAGERRVESFRFPLPASASATVNAKLHYEHAPTGGAENRTRFTFQSETRNVAPEAGPGG